jgi:hypothetical protein
MSDMYYDKCKKYDTSEYLTPQIKDRLTPDEVSRETAIIETYAKDLEDSHIELNAFDGYRAKVAKARLHRHYTTKQGISQ